ncbi:hypothetical protein GIB67_043112 [Kingdonia uniflora]|uniref:Uncharacterized protein n=1 Tax=Kingdonia uniflora TaxID=39325 RepID=A0A7J7NJ20_9MAGN|nr:hypothetical protein GIB67_043112 [Kingdonia uniflora]
MSTKNHRKKRLWRLPLIRVGRKTMPLSKVGRKTSSSHYWVEYNKRGIMPLPDYIKQFKRICDELAVMQKPVSDDEKVNWLANGLGPNYFNFCDAQLSKPLTPTYSQFITALQNHELRNQAYTEERVLDHHMAFMGQRGSRGGRFRGRGCRFSSQGRGFVPSSQYYNSNQEQRRYYNSQGYSRNHSQPSFSNF